MRHGLFSRRRWPRPFGGPSLTRSVDFSLPKPEEAMAVPVGPRHRLGDLGQAAESLAIPGEALLQDHDPLEPALPFTNEQRAGLQCDALPSQPRPPDSGAFLSPAASALRDAA